MIKTLSDINEVHLDVLREIGNIGAGNAAMSLSVLLNENVHIALSEVHIESFENVISHLGGPEKQVVTVVVNFYGDANGVVFFILSLEDADRITDILSSQTFSEEVGEEMKLSAIMEIGNILGYSFLGSIATLTGMEIKVDVPHVSRDMIGAIMADPIAIYGASDNKVMFVEESFRSDFSNLYSHVILFAEMDTLNQIMHRLGL
ncbi:MAG: chemotaxis protein CheC [Clostridiales Family XIII bacterium]|nr:chemotaxis protein CheC [Clostridiales Family XIII bacterium]